MIIYFIRGLPGSGKSTLAKELVHLHDMADNDAVHIEADMFFTNDNGKYEWDGRKIVDAHEWCHAEYLKALRDKRPYIIVSNVSATANQVEWYQGEAEQNGYEFVSLIVENRGGRKSIHDVPEKSIESMRRKFDVQL